MKLILPILLLSILFSGSIFAQKVVPITLEKVLEMGGANNLTIKEYQERQQLAKAKWSKSKEWWLPEFYAGAQSNFLNGAVMNGNGNFFLDVNRNNFWLGLGLNVNWDLAEAIYGTKAARLQKAASIYHSEAERNKMLLQCIKAYYDLLAAQLKLVAYQNLVAQSAQIVREIQIQVDAGLLYQSEVLLSKGNKNHLKVEMLNAQMTYQTTSAELRKLLHLEPNVKLVSVDSILLPLNYTENLSSPVDSSHWNRPEMKAMELDIRALQAKQQSYTTGLLLPTLSLGTNGAYFGRFNGAVNPMDPIAFPTTHQLYPTGTLNAALMWKIPLGALTYQGDNKQYQSKIRIKEIQTQQFKDQVTQEVANATTQIQIGKEQVTITKEALDLTTEALSQSLERQKMGTAKSFEVFQTQQFYLRAQLDYLESISAYNKAQFAMKVAKGQRLVIGGK